MKNTIKIGQFTLSADECDLTFPPALVGAVEASLMAAVDLSKRERDLKNTNGSIYHATIRPQGEQWLAVLTFDHPIELYQAPEIFWPIGELEHWINLHAVSGRFEHSGYEGEIEEGRATLVFDREDSPHWEEER